MSTETAEKVTLKKHSATLEVLHRLSKNKAAMLGLIIFLLEILIALLAPLIMPYSYLDMDYSNMCAAPSLQHLMGTDDLGRDILSRLMYGARFSLGLGISGVLFSTVCGVVIGAIAGYFGGMVDNIIMRIMDIFQSIPGILLSVAISTTLGTGFFNTVMALSVSQIPATARILRGSILNIRKMEYLEAADSINSSRLRTIVSHVLPNSFSPLIVAGTMGVAGTIMQAATLSYIGLGIQAPTPEWGAMLSSARNYMRKYPHTVLFPGLAIAITVFALNIMGDGLRDALDPKLKD